jgi:hypothetical protein
LCTYFYCFVVVLLFCVFYVLYLFCCYSFLCTFIFVCTSVGLLPPCESPIAVSNSNNNNNNTFYVDPTCYNFIRLSYIIVINVELTEI